MEEIPQYLDGVNGLLLFFCLSTAIFGPILDVVAAFHTKSLAVFVIYLAFSAFAAITGGFVWCVHWRALRLVRIYLLSVLCLAGLGVLGSLTILQRAPGGASVEHVVPLLNNLRSFLITFLWWRYFRLSRRVKATFGENMGGLRELFQAWFGEP